jgi:hypothetical protein
MSTGLEAAIRAVSCGGPAQVAEANTFLLAFVESDEAWQPALDLVRSSTNDFISSFASNFLYTKIRKHWSKLNQEQRQEVFGILSVKLNDLAKQSAAVNKLVVNRLALALLCICSRIPNGVKSFVSHAFTLYSDPQFQGLGSGPKLIALEMLAVVPGEVSQLDISREMRLELEQGLLDFLTPVLGLLQAAAGCQAEGAATMLRLGVSSVLHAWLSVGVTLDTLFIDHRPLLEFVLSELSLSCVENVKKACTILSKVMTVKEHPRSGVRDEATFWVLGEIMNATSSFAQYFGEDGDEDVAFEIIDCIVSIVVAELPFLCRPDRFQASIFDLLLMFLRQKPRKLASITFDIWCNLDDIPVRERHPFLTGAGDRARGASIYTQVLEVLVLQCMHHPEDMEDDDCEDIDSFRDGRQGIQEVFIACYVANSMAFLETLNAALAASSCLDSDGGAGATAGAGFARSASLEAVLHAMHLVMGDVQESVKNRSQDPAGYQPVLAFIQAVTQGVFDLVSKSESNAHTHILLGTACTFLGSCTFLLTCTDMDTVAERQRDFAPLFSPALSFLFRALLFPNAAVALSAAKSILKLTTHGKALLLIPYVEEMSVIQSMIQLLSPLLAQEAASPASPRVVSPRNPRAAAPHASSSDRDPAILVVLEAIIRLLVQLPPRLADSYISSVGALCIEQLDRGVFAAAQTAEAGAAPDLEWAIVRPLQHICKIIKFCDVLFMPPLPSPGKGVEIRKPVEVLLPFLGSVWSSLQRAEESCLKLGFLQAIDEIFNVYSGILFSCRDIVAISELPRLGGFIVSVFKQFHRASAASCATSAIESLVVVGPEVWSVFFVPLVCSMAMALPDPNPGPGSPRGHGAASGSWAQWASGEEDSTGGALEAYLTLLHRCVLLCPDVMLTPFSADTPAGRVTFQAFDVAAGQIFGILEACTELAPLRATLLLVQCLFSCPLSAPQFVTSPSSLSVETYTSRDAIVARSIEKIGQGVIHYILHSLSQQNMPSMLWTLATDTMSSVIVSCCGNAKSDLTQECRQWFIALLSDGGILPLVPPEYRAVLLEVFMQYPLFEKRRFKLFMQDLNKICANEQGPETLLDYTVSN